MKRADERAATKKIPASTSLVLPRFICHRRGFASILRSSVRCEIFQWSISPVDLRSTARSAYFCVDCFVQFNLYSPPCIPGEICEFLSFPPKFHSWNLHFLLKKIFLGSLVMSMGMAMCFLIGLRSEISSHWFMIILNMKLIIVLNLLRSLTLILTKPS